jgi:hypothetical protein
MISPLRRVIEGAPRARSLRISLRSRCTAMLAGLRTLIQTRHGPDRYVLSNFFSTKPSAPSRHACAKTIGPSSTMCSLNRMPASVLRNSRTSAAFEEWQKAQIREGPFVQPSAYSAPCTNIANHASMTAQTSCPLSGLPGSSCHHTSPAFSGWHATVSMHSESPAPLAKIEITSSN